MTFHWQGKENDLKNEETVNEIDENNMNGIIEPKRKKLRKSQVEVLQEFFRTLPNVESHYCRKSTSKIYWRSNWKSKR